MHCRMIGGVWMRDGKEEWILVRRRKREKKKEKEEEKVKRKEKEKRMCVKKER